MVSRYFLFIVLIIAIGFVSCRNKKVDATNILSQDQITEKLLEANKAAVIAENEQIDKYILRNGWQMIATGTGLRYQFIEKGTGVKASAGMQVNFEYEVQLLTGETIYSSTQSGPKEFMLGKGGVESGLEEGMLLLHVGDKVIFIIPSYLAHGLSGDQDRIPSKATLIYTIKLIDLK